MHAPTLNCSVSDAAGNHAISLKRFVVVRDTTPPVLTLLGSTSLTLEFGATFVDPGTSKFMFKQLID